MNKPKALFYAPIDCYSGYSACSRERIKALIEIYGDKWDIQIISCGWGTTPNGFIDKHEEWKFLNPYILKENLTYKPDLMFWFTIPSEAKPIGNWNCLWTAGIETDVCAPQWIDAINELDLVIVSSKHAKDVFLTSQFDKQDKNTKQIVGRIKCEKPIEVIHEGFIPEIYKFLPTIEDSSEIKKTLDKIDESFNFLYVGHWLQGKIGEDRKNVGALIKVFFETFKNKKTKPSLILKTMAGSCSIQDRDEILKRIDSIRQTVKSSDLPNVYLIHGDITDQEMNELYNHPKVKAMISLTKGEGYGKPLIEFTQSKKPLIVSGWSGHLDFCKADCTTLIPGTLTPIHESAQIKDMLIEGSRWFSPDLGHAGAVMKDYFENYKKYQENGPRLGYYCKQNFDYNSMVIKIKEVIDREIKLPYSLKLPELKIVK